MAYGWPQSGGEAANATGPLHLGRDGALVDGPLPAPLPGVQRALHRCRPVADDDHRIGPGMLQSLVLFINFGFWSLLAPTGGVSTTRRCQRQGRR